MIGPSVFTRTAMVPSEQAAVSEDPACIRWVHISKSLLLLKHNAVYVDILPVALMHIVAGVYQFPEWILIIWSACESWSHTHSSSYTK